MRHTAQNLTVKGARKKLGHWSLHGGAGLSLPCPASGRIAKSIGAAGAA